MWYDDFSVRRTNHPRLLGKGYAGAQCKDLYSTRAGGMVIDTRTCCTFVATVEVFDNTAYLSSFRSLSRRTVGKGIHFSRSYISGSQKRVNGHVVLENLSHPKKWSSSSSSTNVVAAVFDNMAINADLTSFSVLPGIWRRGPRDIDGTSRLMGYDLWEVHFDINVQQYARVSELYAVKRDRAEIFVLEGVCHAKSRAEQTSDCYVEPVTTLPTTSRRTREQTGM